jgi:hypothetical protein
MAGGWPFLITVALLGVALAPQPAMTVGKAGCGSFYQDKACREDCGSCGQPCCVLEWEIALPAKEVRDRLMAQVFNESTDSGQPALI